MTGNRETYFRSVLDGSNRSIGARLLRTAAACAEPFYSIAMCARNALYAANILSVRDLGRPTISVGNITTGGTGKTPVVRWLAEQMIRTDNTPAILLRGYRPNHAGLSDEQTLLQNNLPSTPVIANPVRLKGAATALSQNPHIKTFILDDAMQHRRARRDVDLVLINAANPFGGNRVFPRGLLREPLPGLRRAHAFLITHASEAPKENLVKIEKLLNQYNPSAPIFHADHDLQGFSSSDETPIPLNALLNRRYFAFCGIGSPASFFSKLANLGAAPAGQSAFPDHHDYTPADWHALIQQATAAGADLLITTEKDWVKLKTLPAAKSGSLPLWRATLGLQFHENDEQRLLSLIQSRLLPRLSP